VPGRTHWIEILGSLGAFAALTSQAAGDSVLRGDVRLTRWLQGREWPGFEPLTDAANWSARSVPLVIASLVIVVAMIWRRWWAESAVLLPAVVIMHASYLLKEIIASPRPTPDLVDVTETGGGFGYPGGRAGNIVLFLGAIAWIAGRRIDSRIVKSVMWLAAGFWIVLTGVARIHVGAHWPSDILGAWLWTIPALMLIIGTANHWHFGDPDGTRA
jgi:membrane-associated phospholipid phosphatase